MTFIPRNEVQGDRLTISVWAEDATEDEVDQARDVFAAAGSYSEAQSGGRALFTMTAPADSTVWHDIWPKLNAPAPKRDRTPPPVVVERVPRDPRLP